MPPAPGKEVCSISDTRARVVHEMRIMCLPHLKQESTREPKNHGSHGDPPHYALFLSIDERPGFFPLPPSWPVCQKGCGFSFQWQWIVCHPHVSCNKLLNAHMPGYV